MGKRTPLYETHVALDAKMVDFGGWDMPLHYGSQIEEHHQVRRDAGLFDVSHMTIVDLNGPGVRPFLRRLVANDVDRLQRPGKALYTCMLNDSGGIIDDLIIFFLGDDAYRVVFNAATRDKVMAWVNGRSGEYALTVKERDDLAMIAVQGPRARNLVHGILDGAARQSVEALAPFYGTALDGLFVSRTGYTGEDGYEIIVPNERAPDLWRRLMDAGARPCGLAARDTLRLEAGMNLNGTDMDETVSPLEAGLAWTVAWEPRDRDFVGRKALEERRERGGPAWVGLILESKGMLRDHQAVCRDGERIGEITSGSFSPTLGKAIAFARITGDAPDRCQVEIRGRMAPVRVVKLPFVRHGKSRYNDM